MYIYLRVGGNPGEVAHLQEPNHLHQEERPEGHSDSVCFFPSQAGDMPIKYLLMIIIIKCVTERHLLN